MLQRTAEGIQEFVVTCVKLDRCKILADMLYCGYPGHCAVGANVGKPSCIRLCLNGGAILQLPSVHSCTCILKIGISGRCPTAPLVIIGTFV